MRNHQLPPTRSSSLGVTGRSTTAADRPLPVVGSLETNVVKRAKEKDSPVLAGARLHETPPRQTLDRSKSHSSISMLSGKARAHRRERTFIGAACAACEEALEHTLRGERILQLTCLHLVHEACFYEYIKEFEAQHCPTCSAPLGLDTSRGGSIDFVSLNKLVRSAREHQASPAPWDTQPGEQPEQDAANGPQPPTRDHLLPEESRTNGFHHDRQQSLHTRKRSGDTGHASATETSNTVGRRNDYDSETVSTTSRHAARNPIPAPTVTVRSEFPTLTKSRQQQSLTCLVTVEVVDKKWQPNPEDLRSPPPVPPIPEDVYRSPSQPSRAETTSQLTQAVDSVHEDRQALEEVKEELYRRCENWHGLDFGRFGRLILHGTMRVSKDRQAWQDLECYLFTEMLICVKARKVTPNGSQLWEGGEEPKPLRKVALKGSILIKKHLKHVETLPDTEILTLSLSVPELPHFYLQFKEHTHLLNWRRTLLNINIVSSPNLQASEFDQDYPGTDEDEGVKSFRANKRLSSAMSSSLGASRSQVTVPTEYTNSRIGLQEMRLTTSTIHVPIDVVVVIPVSSSMQGLKISVLRDSLRFLVANLGERDRMGLVTFGAGGSGVPLVGMTPKTWNGWSQVLESIRPIGQKNIRADAVDGANVAMDLLMQRKSSNALSSIILISDSGTADHESVDFVVSRAEAAKVAIHSFGLGLTHKPDILVELATKTKASYTYAKDWMMLRECLAGCMGALQSTSHQNVKLKLRLPEGSPAKFVKISGALQVSKRSSGRDAEVSLGDLRFGDKRDVLVQLAIVPDASTPDATLSDPWDNIISGLEALSGPLEQEESHPVSVEELPLLQADLSWGDILRDGHLAHSPRPSLLAITMLPMASRRNTRLEPASPPIPPHPSIVQRRMELLTSDMLSRALTLVSRGQGERAAHLLAETRSILKGFSKGSLPPLPPPPSALPPTAKTNDIASPTAAQIPLPEGRRTPSPPRDIRNPMPPAAGIDATTLMALDAELESSLEWISHPAVFVRDSRKAVLQTIGVISSQRAYAFRTPAETFWASRISGIKRLSECSRDWRETGDECLMEE